MRLKATIENVITFQRIVQSIERQSKTCIMRFSPTTLQIICAGESEGGVQVWSQIKVETLFTDLTILSNSNNEITCEVQTEPLHQALKSASSSVDMTMKLAKRDNVAVFCFEVQVQSRQGKRMEITHDVRVKILKPSEVQALEEPRCPEPDIHIILPPLAKIRTVVERMARLSTLVGVYANADGQFKLGIETDNVEVQTVWSDCPLPHLLGNGQEQEADQTGEDDEKPYHAVILSIRSLARFLSSHVVSTTTIACICSNHCLILYVYIGDVEDSGGVLTFFIPSRLDDDAD